MLTSLKLSWKTRFNFQRCKQGLLAVTPANSTTDGQVWALFILHACLASVHVTGVDTHTSTLVRTTWVWPFVHVYVNVGVCVYKFSQELVHPRWDAGCCCRPVRLGGCCWVWQRQESSSRCELSSLVFGSLAALPLAPNTAVTWPTEQGCVVVCLSMRAENLYINPQ